MSKIDWERPKFAWERTQNEDYLLHSDKTSLATRKNDKSVIRQTSELRFKEPYEIINLYVHRILTNTNINITDIQCKVVYGETSIELNTRNQLAIDIAKYLEKCSDISNLRTTKTSNKHRKISFISAHPVKPTLYPDIQKRKRLSLPSESELSRPITIKSIQYQTKQTSKSEWEIRRTTIGTKMRYLISDTFVINYLFGEVRDNGGELISIMDSDYPLSNFYVQAVFDLETFQYTNFHFLDMNLRRLDESYILRFQFPNIRITIRTLKVLIYQLYFHSWDEIISEGPLEVTYGKPH